MNSPVKHKYADHSYHVYNDQQNKVQIVLFQNTVLKAEKMMRQEEDSLIFQPPAPQLLFLVEP